MLLEKFHCIKRSLLQVKQIDQFFSKELNFQESALRGKRYCLGSIFSLWGCHYREYDFG